MNATKLNWISTQFRCSFPHPMALIMMFKLLPHKKTMWMNQFRALEWGDNIVGGGNSSTFSSSSLAHLSSSASVDPCGREEKIINFSKSHTPFQFVLITSTLLRCNAPPYEIELPAYRRRLLTSIFPLTKPFANVNSIKISPPADSRA